MTARWKRWSGVARVIALTVAIGLLSAHLWESAAGDIGGYATYADAFWRGSPPFNALPQEYPPPALAPFALALVPLLGAPREVGRR